MKIIFLDIDGVLNSAKSMKLSGSDHISIWYVLRLNKIVQSTGAKVVISSSWRLYNTIEQIIKFLKEACFVGEVIDVTPEINGAQRGEEIDLWLSMHDDIESFVILDDNSDMWIHQNKLVQTNFDNGLQNSQVSQAIEILNQ